MIAFVHGALSGAGSTAGFMLGGMPGAMAGAAAGGFLGTLAEQAINGDPLNVACAAKAALVEGLLAGAFGVAGKLLGPLLGRVGRALANTRIGQAVGRLVNKAAVAAKRSLVKLKNKLSPQKAPKNTLQHFDDVAAKRQNLGLPTAGSAADDATVAKIKIGDDEFYGLNRKYQNPKTKVTIRANAQTKTHAEADAVQQAIDAGKKGSAKEAEMWVDRDACDACGKYNGIGSLAREIGVEKITVHSPSGTTIYYPPKTK